MLLADKRALETNLKVSLLSIREKELNYYTSNCIAIGTQSALLAGFAYAALQTTVDKNPVWVHMIYLICSVASLGFQLVAVVSTTLLAMIGPGLALRGPDGSMHTAVDNMIGEYRNAFFAYLKGLLALHGAAIAYSIIMLQTWFETIVICICISISLYLVLRYIRVLLARFAIPADGAVTGKFERGEDLVTGAASGVKDLGEIKTLSHLIHKQEGVSPNTSTNSLPSFPAPRHASLNPNCSTSSLPSLSEPRSVPSISGSATPASVSRRDSKISSSTCSPVSSSRRHMSAASLSSANTCGGGTSVTFQPSGSQRSRAQTHVAAEGRE